MENPRLHLVLVVDDQHLVALAHQTALESAGFLVATAASMEEALGVLSRVHPSVAVVDLTLGRELDGLPLARELGRRGVEVIVSSAYDPKALPEGSIPDCVDGFIRKPHSVEQLLSAVRRSLEPSA